MSLKGLAVALLALAAVVVASPQGKAASAPEIDAGVDATLDTFFYQVRGARELAHKAVGILVFPSIVKAGFGFGGQIAVQCERYGVHQPATAKPLVRWAAS